MKDLAQWLCQSLTVDQLRSRQFREGLQVRWPKVKPGDRARRSGGRRREKRDLGIGVYKSNTPTMEITLHPWCNLWTSENSGGAFKEWCNLVGGINSPLPNTVTGWTLVEYIAWITIVPSLFPCSLPSPIPYPFCLVITSPIPTKGMWYRGDNFNNQDKIFHLENGYRVGWV